MRPRFTAAPPSHRDPENPQTGIRNPVSLLPWPCSGAPRTRAPSRWNECHRMQLDAQAFKDAYQPAFGDPALPSFIPTRANDPSTLPLESVLSSIAFPMLAFHSPHAFERDGNDDARRILGQIMDCSDPTNSVRYYGSFLRAGNRTYIDPTGQFGFDTVKIQVSISSLPCQSVVKIPILLSRHPLDLGECLGGVETGFEGEACAGCVQTGHGEDVCAAGAQTQSHESVTKVTAGIKCEA